MKRSEVIEMNLQQGLCQARYPGRVLSTLPDVDREAIEDTVAEFMVLIQVLRVTERNIDTPGRSGQQLRRELSIE